MLRIDAGALKGRSFRKRVQDSKDLTFYVIYPGYDGNVLAERGKVYDKVYSFSVWPE